MFRLKSQQFGIGQRNHAGSRFPYPYIGICVLILDVSSGIEIYIHVLILTNTCINWSLSLSVTGGRRHIMASWHMAAPATESLSCAGAWL